MPDRARLLLPAGRRQCRRVPALRLGSSSFRSAASASLFPGRMATDASKAGPPGRRAWRGLDRAGRNKTRRRFTRAQPATKARALATPISPSQPSTRASGRPRPTTDRLRVAAGADVFCWAAARRRCRGRRGPSESRRRPYPWDLFCALRPGTRDVTRPRSGPGASPVRSTWRTGHPRRASLARWGGEGGPPRKTNSCVNITAHACGASRDRALPSSDALSGRGAQGEKRNSPSSLTGVPSPGAGALVRCCESKPRPLGRIASIMIAALLSGAAHPGSPVPRQIPPLGNLAMDRVRWPAVRLSVSLALCLFSLGRGHAENSAKENKPRSKGTSRRRLRPPGLGRPRRAPADMALDPFG